MLLEGRTYVPLLHARLAEMRAMSEIPASLRERMLPLVRLRPWLTSRSLDKAFDVINDAVDFRGYGLDLDNFARDSASKKPAKQEFERLFNPALGFEAYYDKVEENENIIPVFRELSGQNPQIPLQLQRASDIGRGIFIRVNVAQPGRFLEVAQRCIDQDISNAVFIFDAGWNTNILPYAAICSGLINSLLDITEEYEVVVSGSTFPDKFSNRGTRFSFQIGERPFFQTVQGQINRKELTYGDWASTRPPAEPVPMRNTPRIDTAQVERWNCWIGDDETYQEVAERVVDDPLWEDNSDVWGNYVIASTAAGEDPSIKSATMAAAVRINLHLVAQASQGDLGLVSLGDEAVGEDL